MPITHSDRIFLGLQVDYIIKKGLGGGMIWSLETDDFRGKCGDGKYPLLSTIASKLNGPIIRNTLPPEEIGTQGTTVPPGQMFKCTKEGYFKDPSDCTKFYFCVAQPQGEFARHTYTCGEGQAFDERYGTCNFRDQVPGC